MKGKLLLIGLLALAIAISGCVQPTACTMEARVCPDGSNVGRNPALNCEFDPCPTVECKGEGEAIPIIAEPPECCAGLEIIPPKEADIVGINGICTAKCGNGTCDTETESKINCLEDCEEGGGPLYNCGDGECQDWELTETHPGYCPEDCEEEFCEIGKEYEHNAVFPVACVCPEGYEFETLSTGWGPCPGDGITDCPASVLKCV